MPKVYIVCGPTASGKTALSIDLAKKHNAVIINADAFQIYKEIPICSASPTFEDLSAVEHWMYNYVSVLEEYSVGRYIADLEVCIEKALKSNANIVIVGGTGFYISAILNGIDKIPEVPLEVREKSRNMFVNLGKADFYKMLTGLIPDLETRIRPTDSQRMMRVHEVFLSSGKPIWSFYGNASPIVKDLEVEMIKILPPREELYARCDSRLHELIGNGAIEEVARLVPIWSKMQLSPKKAILVSELYQYLNEKLSLEEVIKLGQQNTRNYAKRQYTWFRNRFASF